MSHYYFNAVLSSKILTYCTILNKNSVRKQFLPKVAETLVETCFCQDGLNRFKPRFKPVLAETCQPWCQSTESNTDPHNGHEM